MTEADKQTFAVLMLRLAKATREELDKTDMSVYFEGLHAFSIEAVGHGVNAAIGREKRFPSVALLKDYVRAAPKPKPQEVVLLPELSIEKQKELMREIFQALNGKFGTNFKA